MYSVFRQFVCLQDMCLQHTVVNQPETHVGTTVTLKNPPPHYIPLHGIQMQISSFLFEQRTGIITNHHKAPASTQPTGLTTTIRPHHNAPASLQRSGLTATLRPLTPRVPWLERSGMIFQRSVLEYHEFRGLTVVMRP